MNRSLRSLRLAAYALVIASGTLTQAYAMAEPVTDAAITAIVDGYKAKNKEIADKKLAGAEAFKARQAAVTELLATLDFQSLTASQIQTLSRASILRFAPEKSAAVESRLAAIASSDKGVDGFKAGLMKLDYIRFSRAQDQSQEDAQKAYGERIATAFTAALDHPGMADAVKAGSAADIFGRFGMIDASALKGTNTLDRVVSLITPELPLGSAARAVSVFDAANEEESGISAEKKEEIRTKIVAALDAGLSKETDTNIKSSAERSRTYLTGAFAMGKLVNHPAPDMNFKWTSAGIDAKKLSDLKGKVVVVDFWATWCGPCVGSFPQVRDLQARYKDYPVVILGVTSIQGSITKWADGRPTGSEDVKGQPEKELELLAQWGKDMDVTWQVAVSEQDVFNPEYGVRGIPHVAIIDPKGVVRHRGLHPAADPEHKFEMIDTLLKEAGLPAPESSATKTEQGEKKQGG